MPLAATPRPRPRLPWWLIVTIFGAALICNLRVAGTSPILWNDTVYEEREVQACLRLNSCTPLGTSASLAGVSFASGWLAMRDALSVLGLGLDGTHVAVQVLRSLGVVIAVVTAFRASGLTAAALAMLFTCSGSVALGATWIMPVFADGTLQTALYNVVVLPFLGALLMLLCVLALEEDGLVALILAALVAAIMANVHVACASAGVSALIVAALGKQHRWRRILSAGFVFIVASFTIAPTAWIHDTVELRKQLGAPDPARLHLPPQDVTRPALLLAGLLFAWAMSIAFRSDQSVRLRRGLVVALLIGAPPLVAVIVAGRLGLTLAEPRYYGYIAPVLGTAAAMVIATVLGQLVQRGLIRDEEDLNQFRVLDRSTVFGAGLFIWLVPLPGELNLVPRLPVSTLRAVTESLRDDLHWSWPQTFRGLKTPHTQDAIQLMATYPGEWPASSNEAHGNTVILIPVSSAPPQQGKPAEVQLLSGTGPWRGLRATTHSGLDWSRFESCAVEQTGFTRCESTGLTPPTNDDVHEARAPLRGLPSVGDAVHLQKLVIKFPWQPNDRGAEAIFMPRLSDVCGGRVVAVPEGGRVSEDGRRALLATAGTVTLEWVFGSSECPVPTYAQFPPFFLAGEPDVIEYLSGVLSSRERT